MKNITGKDLARFASDALNTTLDNEIIEAFVMQMGGEHRTLQQTFTRLTLAWLKHLASLGERQYDGRNAASVRFAQAALAGCQNNEDCLPPI